MDGFARSLTAFNARLKELFRARHTQSNRLNYFLCVFPTCAVCLCCLFRELCSVSWLRLLLNVTTLGRSKWQLSRKKGGFLLSLCQQRAATNKLACWLLRVFSDTSSESHKGFFWIFQMCCPDLQEHIAQKEVLFFFFFFVYFWELLVFAADGGSLFSHVSAKKKTHKHKGSEEKQKRRWRKWTRRTKHFELRHPGPSHQSVRLAPHLPRPDVHLPIAHWPAHLLTAPPPQ